MSCVRSNCGNEETRFHLNLHTIPPFGTPLSPSLSFILPFIPIPNVD